MNLVNKLLGNDEVSVRATRKKEYMKYIVSKEKDENGNKYYRFTHTTPGGSRYETTYFYRFRILKKPIIGSLHLVSSDSDYLMDLDLERMVKDYDYYSRIAKLIMKKHSNPYSTKPEDIYLGEVVENGNEVSLKRDEKSMKRAEPFIKLIAEERVEKHSEIYKEKLDSIMKELVSMTEKKEDLIKQIGQIDKQIEQLTSKYADAKSKLFDEFGIDFDGVANPYRSGFDGPHRNFK